MSVERVVDHFGTIRWYCSGMLHRDDGPAVVYTDGVRYWCRDGLLHRDDGPAVVYPQGDEYWYQNGDQYLPQLVKI